jgi:hypothetical protein
LQATLSMTPGNATRGSLLSARTWVWLLRGCLLVGATYATYAGIFYGWFASFPGPNQWNAAVVANIWTGVDLVCIAALIVSFVQRRRPSQHNRPTS